MMRESAMALIPTSVTARRAPEGACGPRIGWKTWIRRRGDAPEGACGPRIGRCIWIRRQATMRRRT
eukprot:4441645-Pyramimonas_sp.AAC.2